MQWREKIKCVHRLRFVHKWGVPSFVFRTRHPKMTVSMLLVSCIRDATQDHKAMCRGSRSGVFPPWDHSLTHIRPRRVRHSGQKTSTSLSSFASASERPPFFIYLTATRPLLLVSAALPRHELRVEGSPSSRGRHDHCAESKTRAGPFSTCSRRPALRRPPLRRAAASRRPPPRSAAAR